MQELEELREASLVQLRKSASLPEAEAAVAIERMADVLRLSSEMEISKANLSKLQLECSQLKHEVDTVSERERSDRKKDYVTLLTPVITILGLFATLLVQGTQLTNQMNATRLQTEQARNAELDKLKAAEDAEWAKVSGEASRLANLPPEIVAIRPFLDNPRYRERARSLATRLAVYGRDPNVFTELFGVAFAPVTAQNYTDTVGVSRGLLSRVNPLWTRSWNPKTYENDYTTFTKDEQETVAYVNVVLPKLSSSIGQLLKARKAPQAIDLSDAWFLEADWSGVNLLQADLDNAGLVRIDLGGADLSGVTHFTNASFFGSVWWEAKRLSPELKSYLVEKYPCNVDVRYRSSGAVRFSKSQCDEIMSSIKG